MVEYDIGLATARTLGATQVVNVSVSDPVAVIHDLTDQHGAPIVIEASGAPSAPATALAAVRRGGRVLVVGLQAEPRSLDLYNMTLREVEMTGTVAHVCDVDLPAALEILASSNLAAVVLDRVIPLDALVEEALQTALMQPVFDTPADQIDNRVRHAGQGTSPNMARHLHD